MRLERRHVNWARRGFALCQWAAYAIAVWMLIDAFFVPVVLEQPQLAESDGRVLVAELEGGLTPGQLSGIWQRNIRQTLIDKPRPAAKPKKNAAKKSPPMRLPKLVATMVENGESWGVFESTNGVQRVKRASEQVDGFEIISVGKGRAKLSYNGRVHELKVPRLKREGAAGKRRSRRSW